ncbi:hypothetical protein AC578_9873 [Pseudocercospora eumusae]|nr:hypothetical protein AC578_9873 [Pseudocercospora eumusae]
MAAGDSANNQLRSKAVKRGIGLQTTSGYTIKALLGIIRRIDAEKDGQPIQTRPPQTQIPYIHTGRQMDFHRKHNATSYNMAKCTKERDIKLLNHIWWLENQTASPLDRHEGSGCKYLARPTCAPTSQLSSASSRPRLQNIRSLCMKRRARHISILHVLYKATRRDALSEFTHRSTTLAYWRITCLLSRQNLHS